MSDTRFRLIFKGVTQKAGLQKLIRILKKEFNLTDIVIQNLFANPPRILWEVSARNDADMIRGALYKIGCLADIEPVVSYPACSFSISSVHDKFMRKELSKILRSRSSLALFLVKIEPLSPQIFIPSMMGDITEEIARYFRDSDTVLGIDDQYLMIMAFSTDRTGVDKMRQKINRKLKELFGDNAVISIGYSLFPGNVRSFAEIISLAEKHRHQTLQTQDTVMNNAQQTGAVQLMPETGEEDRFAQLFIGASGRVIKRLLNMDYETILTGIGKLSPQQQKAFLYRLPFDSELAKKYRQFTEDYSVFKPDENMKKHLEAIMHQVDEDYRSRSGKNTDKLKKDVLQELTRAESLATLPTVASQVFRITSDPDKSPEEIAALIMNDPSLTAKLLKTVNSAYYGNVRKVHTVKEAVVLLGADEITDLAFGLAASKVFDVVSGRFINPRQLWRHSLTTALIARHIVKGRPDFEKTGIMTAGLLHDAGKIFLIEHFHNHYEEIMQESVSTELSMIDLEQDTFGLTHAEIGRNLCVHWRLPEQLTDAIAWHHQPMSASENRKIAAVIGLADYISHLIDNDDQQSVKHTPILTVGHWVILKNIFQHLNSQELKKMAEEAQSVINVAHDLLSTF